MAMFWLEQFKVRETLESKKIRSPVEHDLNR